MGVVLAQNCKLYRNTGSYASPTWNEITTAKNVNIVVDTAEADVTTRGASGWKQSVATLRDCSIEFDMVYDTAVDDTAALKTAAFTSATVELLALDGDNATPGNQGVRMTATITKWERSEQMGEALMVKCSAKSAYAANPPAWYTSA